MDELVIFKRIAKSGKPWFALVKTEVISGIVFKLNATLWPDQAEKLINSGIKLVDLTDKK